MAVLLSERDFLICRGRNTIKHAETGTKDGDKADLGGDSFGRVGIAQWSFSLDFER